MTNPAIWGAKGPYPRWLPLPRGREVSIATRVSLLLTAVISLVLLVGAVAFVLYEYNRESSQLLRSHEMAVEQLSVSLTLPLWNYDSEQTQKILQGVMQDPETAGVSLRDARTGEILVAFVRGSNWTPVERRNQVFETKGRAISSEREIKVDGQPIGIVHLESTRHFLWKRMASWVLSTLLAIFILDGILITGVYFLIWHFVLSPLMDLEQYATGIGTDGGRLWVPRPLRFQGEFFRLKNSLSSMVELLQERYRILERQAGFNRWLAMAMERFATVENDQFESLFESLLGELTLILGSDQAFWMDFDANTHTWTVRAASGKGRDLLAKNLQVGHAKPGQPWSDQILMAGEILRVSSRGQEPHLHLVPWENWPWESAVMAPLRTTLNGTETTTGALGLGMVEETKSWDTKDVQCLILFGNAASTARERHRAEVLAKEQAVKLAEAYNLQRLLFDQAFQFIGLLSPDGTLHRANETALTFAGISENQVLGKPFWDTPWWEHDEKQREKLKQSVHRASLGETVRFQSTHRSADGVLHQVDFSIKPVRDLKGDLIWLMPEGRDINDIAEAQKALLASEDRYRSLFENAGDAILLMKDGHFQDCNSKALEIYGVTRDQIIGKTPVDFSPEIQPDGNPSIQLATQKQELARCGQSQQFDWQHRRHDGTHFDAEVTLNLLRHGDTPLLQAIVRDVTLRRHQEELNRRNAEALLQNDKLMALGELAAGMAHEITQPLSGISLAVQGLGIRTLRGPLESKDAEKILADVGGYVERIRRLIEHVRMFSRDRRTESKTVFDARASIEGALSLLGTQLRNNGIELVTRLPAHPLPVVGNLFELEQVLFNLLSNSRYALDRRRESQGFDFKPCVQIEASRTEDTCAISLEDNGCGIPADKKRHLFEPFFTTKPVGEGTGLGLSISRGIIQNMGGDLFIESEAGAFTKVMITLPCSTTPGSTTS